MPATRETRFVWLDGDLVPAGGARISVLNHGFLYGNGVFETILVQKSQPVFPAEHLERLYRGAVCLEIPWPGEKELLRGLTETLRRNEITTGSLRLTLARGEGLPVPDPATCGRPTVLVTGRQGEPYAPEVYRRGFTLVPASFPRNQASPLVQIKSLNYLENLLAKREARQQGFDEALFLNTSGNVAETSAANIFLVDTDRIFTPAADQGLLPGIARAKIIELACAEGLEVVETVIGPAQLKGYREAFLTSSLLGVMPVTRIGKRPLKMGSVTQTLGQKWRELTG